MNDTEAGSNGDDVPTPFSFKLMVVLAVAYLGWRLVEGVIWVIQALSG